MQLYGVKVVSSKSKFKVKWQRANDFEEGKEEKMCVRKALLTLPKPGSNLWLTPQRPPPSQKIHIHSKSPYQAPPHSVMDAVTRAATTEFEGERQQVGLRAPVHKAKTA